MDIQHPIRVVHTYTQSLDGSPEEVLPLLCPVREADWVPGWAPRLVLSESGVAERDCVFITPDAAAGPDAEAIWTITQLDRAAGRVEMLKITPGFLVVRLAIELTASAPAGCRAEVTYQYTALGPAGEAYVAGHTPDAYREFMESWEAALNRYLGSTRVHPVTPA